MLFETCGIFHCNSNPLFWIQKFFSWIFFTQVWSLDDFQQLSGANFLIQIHLVLDLHDVSTVKKFEKMDDFWGAISPLSTVGFQLYFWDGFQIESSFISRNLYLIKGVWRSGMDLSARGLILDYFSIVNFWQFSPLQGYSLIQEFFLLNSFGTLVFLRWMWNFLVGEFLIAFGSLVVFLLQMEFFSLFCILIRYDLAIYAASWLKFWSAWPTINLLQVCMIEI